MQKICLDLKEFKTIRQQGGLYVDKTKYIYEIFGNGSYFFLARPRRFGKSLLCATLAELFAGNRHLFKGLWIDGSDWAWKKHPVIRLDMSKAASPVATPEEVRGYMVDLLNSSAKHLGLPANTLRQGTPMAMLSDLIAQAKEAFGEQVVVIIDEYDKPLLDVIQDRSRYTAIQEELSAFYSQLKPAEEDIRCVLITGVFKFTKTSIFSGLNNLNDITFKPRAAALLGYTEQEIRAVFADHLAAVAAAYKKTVDEMMLVLRDRYNGYFFGVNLASNELSAGVYNPYAMNYVFAEQQQLDRWFSSGSPSALIKKLTSEQFEALEPARLTMSFSALETSCSPDDMTALSMLYYAGYLTLKHCFNKKVTLGFPNAEVAGAFSDALLPALLQKSVFFVAGLIDEIHDLFCQERLDDLKQLLNDALAPVAYPVLAQPAASAELLPERVYQIAFYYLFIASKMPTTLEDMTNRGRIDIVVEGPRSFYIFELKINEPASVAIAQIKEKEYTAKFRHKGKQLYAVGISIDTAKRSVAELMWERF